MSLLHIVFKSFELVLHMFHMDPKNIDTEEQQEEQTHTHLCA